MEELTYNWKRFWHRRGLPINTHSGGYLQDPEGEYGHVLNPNTLPFSAIAEVPCLALLAAPGMGKSRTLEMEREVIDTAVASQGARSLWLNLRAYGDETRLINDLFGSPAFQEWLAGDYRLHIFLDSLDEALLRIDVLTPLLLAELHKYPIERLSLRIACRAADWPAPLEEGLRRLWDKEAVGIYELAPLRYADIAEAARANGVDPDAFLHEVQQMQADPLAIKPVTLDMLLRMYGHPSRFPRTQAELYAAGCRLLCEEENPFRRAARQIGKLLPDQRMLIAGRIAAVTVFANKYAVWMDIDRGDVPEVDVKLSELTLEGEEPALDEDALRETLGTALFSARGPQEMGWAHQTYAEYLAAWYLQRQGMTLPQFMSLLVHTGDNTRKLVPQLHETAAWVAGMVPEVFREVMRTDPEILLRSDVGTVDEADRAALVAALLALYDDGRSIDRSGRPFHKLDHPGLADQLRPYLTDKHRHLEARYAAVDMAEACSVRPLLPELVALCLDPAETLAVRINAAAAVSTIGDEDSKPQLKPLLFDETVDDVGNQLKGRVLQALWPRHLSAAELFKALSPPNIRFAGPYELFLSHNFVAHIQPVDMAIALEWVAGLPPHHELGSSFVKPVNAIFQRAWQYLDEEGILAAFAKAAFSRLKEHDAIVMADRANEPETAQFVQELMAQEDKRRRLALATLPLFTAESDAIWLVFSATPLLINQDVPWLIEQLLASTDPDTQTKFAQLIDRLFSVSDTTQFGLIYDTCQTNTILAETFARFLQPVQLDSPAAQEQKQEHYRRLEWQEKHSKREPVDPPSAERVATCLAWIESGNVAAWARLNQEMTLEIDSTHYGEWLKTDIRQLPGWKEAEPETRLRIVEAARRHILEGDTLADEWLGTNQYPYSVFSSFHALCLLENEMPGFLAELSPALWSKWAPIIYVYRPEAGQEEAIQNEMLRRTYHHAPDEVIRVMLAELEGDLKSENGLVHIPNRLRSCWDDRIAQALLNRAHDTTLAAPALGVILDELLEQHYAPARLFTESLVSVTVVQDSDEWKRAITAARLLMAYAADTSWPTVWSAIQQNAAFGCEVVTVYAHTVDRHGERLRVLSESQLTDFYIWLETEFPHANDPQLVFGVMNAISNRQQVAMWRNGILRLLKQKGTPAACDEIVRIVQAFPHLEWLKITLLEAQHITRQATWVPPTPGDILLLSQDRRRRLVQSGDELLAVVQEALGRLEEKLQGEVPAAIDLWNNPGGTYTPKDENTLSNYIKRFLDTELYERGIVINREVVIRVGTGQNDGERTDVHINAVTRDPQRKSFDVITLIIEVKGCWHDEVLTAMETQLVQRYLKDNKCRHGLYLVGWYYCRQWREVPKKYGSQEALQQILVAQAVSMSAYGVTVEARVLNTAIR